MGSHLYCGIATSLGVIKRKGKASKQELDEIDKALQTIEFELDEEGGKIESNRR